MWMSNLLALYGMCLLRPSNANTFISLAVTPVHPPTYLLTLSFQCRQKPQNYLLHYSLFFIPFIGYKYYQSLSDGFFFSCLFRVQKLCTKVGHWLACPNFFEIFKIIHIALPLLVLSWLLSMQGINCPMHLTVQRCLIRVVQVLELWLWRWRLTKPSLRIRLLLIRCYFQLELGAEATG